MFNENVFDTVEKRYRILGVVITIFNMFSKR